MDDLILPGIDDKPLPNVGLTAKPAPDANISRAFSGKDPDIGETPKEEGAEDEPPVDEAVEQERAVCLRARQRWEYESEVDADNLRTHIEDLKFAWEKGAQWNEQQRRQRETAVPPRPWLEFNQTGQFIKQIVNNQRQNQPAIKVRPKGGGASQKVADILSNAIRDIEYASTAPAIYDSTLEQSTTGGRGYIRLLTEYEAEDSFNQVARLRSIADATQVRFDSSATMPDKCDIKYCFIAEALDREVFEAEWPDASASVSWDTTIESEWGCYFNGSKILVVDYYEIVEEKLDLIVLDTGRVLWSDDYDAMMADYLEQAKQPQTDPVTMLPMPVPMPPQVMKREPRSRCKVAWYKLSACDRPLAKYEWLGKFIPVFMTPGDEINIGGKTLYQGIIRRLRDAQMMYNYWFTLATERIALAPKAPWVMLSGQAENHPEWDTANTENHSRLEYDPVEVSEGNWYVTPPGRTDAIPVDAGLVTMLQICAQNLREITGMKDAVLGQGRPEQPLGAILAEQEKGDVATFHYGDNLHRCVCLIGRALVDLLPKITDVQKELPQRAEDGDASTVMVNMQGPGTPEERNDLTQGEYDVVVDVGPSFASKRTESAKEISEFMSVIGPGPASAAIGAVMAQQVDWPGDVGEKIAGMLGSMLPPAQQKILFGGPDQDPQVASLQAAMEQQQQQFQQFQQMVQGQMQQLQLENTDLKLQVKNKTMDFASDISDQYTRREDMSQGRAIASENNAQQEFSAKLDAATKMMGEFTKMLQMGVDPRIYAQMATQSVESASQQLRSGPDFGDSMQMLVESEERADAQAQGLLQQILPAGVPQPNAPQQPQMGNGAGGPPQQPQPPGPPQGGPPMPPPNGAPQ